MSDLQHTDPKELLTEHFTLSELACHCNKITCVMDDDIKQNLLHTAQMLEIIRASLECSILITSGYRCADHNARVGGSTLSQHLLGRAADWYAVHHSLRSDDLRQHGLWLAGWVGCMMAASAIVHGGIGTYKNVPRLVHVDFRGSLVTWRK